MSFEELRSAHSACAPAWVPRAAGSNGNIGKVQAFLYDAQADLNAGMLTRAQADFLVGPGKLLLLGLTRR